VVVIVVVVVVAAAAALVQAQKKPNSKEIKPLKQGINSQTNKGKKQK
jgi:hypothetical protein